MRRFFTILEGERKGGRLPLTAALMIVGRSKNADLQIEDSLVSRRHLEVRVEAEAVFVENRSDHGSILNGKPLVSAVSLHSGDVLEIGRTKLCYGEAADDAMLPAGEANSVEGLSGEIDGTRVAEHAAEANPRKGQEAAPDATRAVGDDGTRMLNAAELPNWAPQEKKEQAASSGSKAAGIFWAIVVLLLLGGGGWYWLGRGGEKATPGRPMAYQDSLYGFSLEYPLDWSRLRDESGVMTLGSGGTAGAGAQLNIFTDKDTAHALTGLTDGFVQYQEILKQRYPGFELSGSKPLNVNNVAVVFYGFSTPKLQGKGIYLLNAESRLVVEGVSPSASYAQFAPVFSAILQSFRLSGAASQQYIDFPLPDEAMQQLALANPAELAREVDAKAQLGAMLLASPDVKPGNLYESVQVYRQAMQLAIAPPRRVADYEAVAGGLRDATQALNRALDVQRFEISRARNDGDYDAAYWAANKMMQMVGDKTDPAYQEAARVVRALPRPRH